MAGAGAAGKLLWLKLMCFVEPALTFARPLTQATTAQSPSLIIPAVLSLATLTGFRMSRDDHEFEGVSMRRRLMMAVRATPPRTRTGMRREVTGTGGARESDRGKVVKTDDVRMEQEPFANS